VGAMTTAGTHGSRANRAGSLSNTMPGEVRGRAGRLRTENRGYVCLEADQPLQSARKNTHDNRDKGTRQSAGTNEGRRSPWKAARMRWPNCANMLQHRRRCSTLAWKKAKLRMSPRPMTVSASDAWELGALATRFRTETSAHKRCVSRNLV
jgi:hypothetical protein